VDKVGGEGRWEVEDERWEMGGGRLEEVRKKEREVRFSRKIF